MRSQIYEQALTKAGVQWRYEEAIPLDQINTTRGKQMQAVLDPLNKDLIENYRIMFNDGLVPPALVTWQQSPKSKHIPMDGNQRLAANEQAKPSVRKKTWDAYVLLTDDPMVAERICWSFNNMVNGRRLSYDECMEHAITFVRKYNQQVSAAAKEWGVKEWQLSAMCVELDMRDLAMANSVVIPTAFANEAVVTVASLRKLGDDVAVKALKAAVENGLGILQCRDLCKEVKKAPTSKAKLTAVDDFCKQETIVKNRAETKGGRVRHMPTRLPRVQLQKLVEQTDMLLGEYEKKALQPIGKEDTAEYRERALRVVNRLVAIYGLGSFVAGQEVV